MSKTNDRYFSQVEAAEYLKCSLPTLRKYMTEHRIAYYKISERRTMFDKDDLDEFITRNRVSSNQEVKSKAYCQ